MTTMLQPDPSTACFDGQTLQSYSRGTLQPELVLSCEEHLSNCAQCLALLIELFESGRQPDWLSTCRRRAEPNHVVEATQLSTFAKEDAARCSSDAPQLTAYRVWQQLKPGQSVAQHPTAVPETIGRYRIDRVLGYGGFGRVYLAYDEKLKRHVALKVPHPTGQKKQVDWDLVLSEAQTVAALDHPWIVPIFDVASTDEIPLFLVSKLIVGQTLAERLTTHQLETLDAVKIVLRVAEVLEYAHAQDVIHRDIKPQNILLDSDCRAFLSDFGLAWRGAEDSRSFPAAGTPFYMSPEQLAGELHAIDHRSDIYSLGRILQEVLGLREFNVHPFSSEATSAPVAGELVAICEKATAIKPENRYQQAGQLTNALRMWINAQQPKPLAAGKRPLAISLGILGCVMLIAMAWQGDRPAVHSATEVAKHDLPSSVESLLSCSPDAFQSKVAQLSDELPQVVTLLREQVHTKRPLPELSLLDLQRRHAAAIVLLKLGHDEDYWPLWESCNDPRAMPVQLARFDQDALTPALFINRLRSTGLMQPIEKLPTNFIERVFKSGLSHRRNLLMALSSAQATTSKHGDAEFLPQIVRLYQSDADPCVHGLAMQILSRAECPAPPLDDSASQYSPGRGWYVNSLAQTMVVVEPNPAVIYRYSIASCELQRHQFEQFVKETGHAWTGSRLGQNTHPVDAQCAQAELSWYDCAAFCNWLSRREGLEECYIPNTDGRYAEGMKIKPDIHTRNGYRLPSSSEWETAARGATFAGFYFGNVPFAKEEYVWDASNAHGVPQPVGRLRPNNIGLFDVHGNVSEWTSPSHLERDGSWPVSSGEGFDHCGGSAHTLSADDLEFGNCVPSPLEDRSHLSGLRIARSLPSQETNDSEITSVKRNRRAK